jgi:hypothetical protein
MRASDEDGRRCPSALDGKEATMRLPKRDLIATGLVLTALALYLMWALDATLPGLDGTRATGAVVLGLGFAASASAVVPGFDGLVHGSRIYLAVTSLIGLVALVAGVQMLLDTSGAALGVLMGAMGVLWLMATIHHMALAGTTAARPPSRRPRHRPRSARVA